jgi:hypothetical protein
MENKNIQSALEILNKPEAVYQFVTGETVPEGSTVPTLDLTDDITADLLVGIAESVSADNATFKQAYQAIQEKNDVVSRSGLGELLPYVSKAHELITGNWAYIFFILQYLNNTGKMDKLKNNPRLKTFFKTLFEE